MTFIKAFIAVAGFAVGPFVVLGLLGSGNMLGAACGLLAGAVYGLSFVAGICLVMDKIEER